MRYRASAWRRIVLVAVSTSLHARCAAAVLLLAGSAWAQQQFSIRGDVVMPDGSPPPRTATIQRVCPGDEPTRVATANKTGEYAWLTTGPRGLWCGGGSAGLQAVMDELESAVVPAGPDMPPLVLRKTANERVPADAGKLWDAAVQASRTGKLAEAETILRSILAAHPQSAPVRTALGIVLTNEGKRLEAMRAVETAIEDNPGYVRSYHVLANLQMDLNDWQAAAKTAAAGVRADPAGSTPALYLDLARIRQRLGQTGVEACVRKAIELDATHQLPEAELALGGILESDGDTYGAAARLRRYLELRPNAPDAPTVRARIQKLESGAAAAAAAGPEVDAPVPEGAALVAVPGGLDALASTVYLGRTPSRADFFREYCRAIIERLNPLAPAGSATVLDPDVGTYLAVVAELSRMADSSGRIMLSLDLDQDRARTERVLALFGWKATRTEAGYSVEPGSSAVDGERQQVPAALGIDEVAMAAALGRLRSYRIVVRSGQAVLLHAQAWKVLVGNPPPGGYAEAFFRNSRFARAYAGLASAQPEAAAALTASGLRTLVETDAAPLMRYGEAFAISAGRAAVPGGLEAEPAWERLAGVGPGEPSRFFQALMDKDYGRLAAFYAALALADAAHRAWFTSSAARAQASYSWFHPLPAPSLVRAPRFLTDWRADLLRDLPLDSSGGVRFPGGAEAWGFAPGAGDDAFLKLPLLEALLPIARLEKGRKAPLDAASVRLLTRYYAVWAPLFPYFEKLTALGPADFEALAAFEKSAAARPQALQNIVLGEWHSLVKLIELGVAAGSLDDAAAARAFRRACEAFAAPDFSARAIAALREIAGGASDLDEAVAANLLRLDSERRAAFDRVRALQQAPPLASTTGDSDSAALAALAGAVYAAVLDPDALLVAEDPLLLKKHNFVECTGAGLFRDSGVTTRREPAAANLCGGFMRFEETARSLSPLKPAPPPALASAPAPPQAPASAFPQPLGAVFQTTTRLVEIYATVTDEQGRYVYDLGPEDFTVLDDGAPVKVGTFETFGSEVSVALLLDTTDSMASALAALRSSALKLIDDLRPIDSVAVYSFNDSTEELQAFTTDKAAVKLAVLHIRHKGTTALHDALVRVTKQISPRTGKKAIVVFTDGADNSSLLASDAAIRAAKEAGVPVYAMAYGDALKSPVLLANLESIASATGGLSLPVRDAAEMNSVFARVSHDITHGYLLSFKPTAVDKRWHALQLVLRNPQGRKVRARGGYFPE